LRRDGVELGGDRFRAAVDDGKADERDVAFI